MNHDSWRNQTVTILLTTYFLLSKVGQFAAQFWLDAKMLIRVSFAALILSTGYNTNTNENSPINKFLQSVSVCLKLLRTDLNSLLVGEFFHAGFFFSKSKNVQLDEEKLAVWSINSASSQLFAWW